MSYASHAEVIAAIGTAALARAIGVSEKMVGGWKTRNSIPGGWFRSVERAAHAVGQVGVTVVVLADLADIRTRTAQLDGLDRPLPAIEEAA